MGFILRTLVILVLLPVLNVHAAKQVKQTKAEQGAKTVIKSEPSSPGGVTMPGSDKLFKPLPPAEEERLGREGVKRKMLEQTH